MTRLAKAQRWGGSVTAPIPAAVARRLKIVPGTPIQVEEREGGVFITPVQKRRSLTEMLHACRRKFPKGNPHGEFDFGPPVGKEVW